MSSRGVGPLRIGAGLDSENTELKESEEESDSESDFESESESSSESEESESCTVQPMKIPSQSMTSNCRPTSRKSNHRMIGDYPASYP